MSTISDAKTLHPFYHPTPFDIVSARTHFHPAHTRVCKELSQIRPPDSASATRTP